MLRFHLPEIDSTNTYLLNWASNADLPEGTLVSADYQTQGKGRLGRRWEAPIGQNLLFSVLLKPTIPQKDWAKLPLVAATSVREVLQQHVAPSVRIKWPNDIWIDGKKVCGMLLENQNKAVVLGIGINVNQTEALLPNATSLSEVSNQTFILEELLEEIQNHLMNAINHFYATKVIPSDYEREMLFIGNKIRFQTTQQSEVFEATVLGISEDGAIRLEKNGLETCYFAGDISTQIS